MNKEYTDALPGVYIATPFQDGYIPKIAHLSLSRFLAENPLPYAGDDSSITPFSRSEKLWSDFERLCNQRLALARFRQASVEEVPPTPQDLEDSKLKAFFNQNQTVEHLVVLELGVQDVKVKSSLSGGRSQVGGGARGEIVEFSAKSRSALESNIRNLPEGSIKYFLTLTMPFWEVGRYLQGDSAKYLMQKMRQWLQYHGVDAGIWFMEFQHNQGNVHFHAYLNKSPVGGLQAVSEHWCKIVSELAPTEDLQRLAYKKMLRVHTGKAEFSRPCLEVMHKEHAASYYASKYCVKSEQKKPPSWFGKCGRFWGAWGKMKPSWNYVYLRGADAAYKAFAMLQEFAKIKGFNPMTSLASEDGGEMPRAFFTRTMRGAMSDLDDWLAMVGLDDALAPCPF